jgi:hypothetical protein
VAKNEEKNLGRVYIPNTVTGVGVHYRVTGGNVELAECNLVFFDRIVNIGHESIATLGEDSFVKRKGKGLRSR